MLLSSQKDSMDKTIKDFKGSIVTGVFSVIVVLAVVILGSYNVKDLQEVKKQKKL